MILIYLFKSVLNLFFYVPCTLLKTSKVSLEVPSYEPDIAPPADSITKIINNSSHEVYYIHYPLPTETFEKFSRWSIFSLHYLMVLKKRIPLMVYETTEFGTL